jgi:hypothetical protein
MVFEIQHQRSIHWRLRQHQACGLHHCRLKLLASFQVRKNQARFQARFKAQEFQALFPASGPSSVHSTVPSTEPSTAPNMAPSTDPSTVLPSLVPTFAPSTFPKARFLAWFQAQFQKHGSKHAPIMSKSKLSNEFQSYRRHSFQPVHQPCSSRQRCDGSQLGAAREQSQLMSKHAIP